MAESKDNVKVAIRVRPLSEKERRESGGKVCVSVQSELGNIVIDARPEQKTFTFDYVADQEVPQEEIFEKVGKAISASCLSGYNGTIFAYGQTGAGKTFTILGPDNDGTMEDYEGSEEFQRRGLMPRCIEHIFSSIAQEMRQTTDVEYLVKASFLEIYQEQVIDLLTAAGIGVNLQLREDIKKGVYVDGLIEENVSSIQDTYDLLKTGTCNRHVGSTSMNKESSRSHSVFTLTIESKQVHDGVTNFRSSRFHMIDLAGSERQKSTDAVGERLREAGMINKSLSALGNVINSLVDIAEGKSRHVHYRDSKLTFLLKDSLGGNSRTFIVANISPSASSFGETLSTLKFAQRAKMIKNKAVVNEDTAGSVHLLKEEIRRLKGELSTMREATLIAIEQCPKCAGLIGKDDKSPLADVSSDRLVRLEVLLEQNTRLRVKDTKALEQLLETKENYIKSLLAQVAKYEKKVSNDKMVLKFRDSTIARLQGNAVSDDPELENARKEIALLREQLEGTSSAAKLFMENERLKEELRALHKEVLEEPDSLTVRLRENQEYTEQVVDWLNEDISTREQMKAIYAEYLQFKSGEIVAESLSVCKPEELVELKLTYADRITDLTEKTQTLESEYAELQESSNRKMEQQAKRIEDLMSENAFLAKKCEEVVTLHSQIEGESSQSADAAKRLETEVSTLTDQLAQAKVALEQESAAKGQFRTRVEALESLLQTASEDLKFLETQQIALQSTLESLTADNATLKQCKLDDENTIAALQIELSTLQTTLESKTAEVTALTLELETAQDDNRFVKTELEELRKSFEDVKDEKVELEGCNDELTRTVKEQEEQFVAMKASLELRIRELEAADELKENQWKATITDLMEKFEQLQEEIAALKGEIARLLAANETLTGENMELHSEKLAVEQEKVAVEQEKEAVEDQLQSALMTTNSLRAELSVSEQEVESLTTQWRDAQGCIDTLTGKLEEVKSRSESLAEQLKETTHRAESLAKELENAAKDSERQLQEIDQLTATTVTKEAECAEVREKFTAELQQKEEKLAILQSEMQEISTKLADAGVEIDTESSPSVVVLVESLKSKILHEESQRDSSEAVINSLRHELEIKGLRIEALESEVQTRVKSLETAVAAFSTRETALKGEIADLMAEVAGREDREEELKAEAARMKGEFAGIQTVVERLRAELKAADVHFSELESALQSEKVKSQQLDQALAGEKQSVLREMGKVTVAERERDAAEKLVGELRGAVAEVREELRSKEREREEMEKEVERLAAAEKEAQVALLQSLESSEAFRDLNQTHVAQIQSLQSSLSTKESEFSRISDALSTAITELEALRSALQESHTRERELQHSRAELLSHFQASEEEGKSHTSALATDKRRLEEKYEEMAKTMRDKESLYEEKTAKLAEHIGLHQKSIEQYQQLLLAAEKKSAELTMELSRRQETVAMVAALRSRAEDLESQLESSHSELKSLRDENRTKQEILQNTNRNILSTRQEIEMWKKCIEEKNEAIQQLRQSLRKCEEEKAAMQGVMKENKGKTACGHEGEIQYIKGVLERREKELFELKEKGQLYYAQADEAIETQRKEIEVLTKRCSIYQNELTKCREELRQFVSTDDRRRFRSHENSSEPAPPEGEKSPLQAYKSKAPKGKDDVMSLKTQLARLKEEVGSKEEQLEGLRQLVRAKGKPPRVEEESVRDQLESQVESLSAGLNKITDYVSSIPIVAFNPEETGIVESTIKAISNIYEAYEQKCRELQAVMKPRPHPDSAAKYQSEPHQAFGSNYVNPANYKNPVAHYHALLNASSIKPGQLLSPSQERRSPLKGKRP